MKFAKKSDQKQICQLLGLALACGSVVSSTAQGQTAAAPLPPPAVKSNTNSAPGTNTLEEVTVEGSIDDIRTTIDASIGTSSYTINAEAIQNEASGNNASFNQILLRAPGVAQDSLGQVHVRGEHANLQYRVNDVLLPEGISGFGSEFDPRFVQSMELLTGPLPSEFGFRTAGIVDITTKSGAALNGGSAEVYGGSYDTIRPSFEYGTTVGKTSLFVNGSYDHNDLGIENSSPNSVPIHDYTDQYKLFMYYSYAMDPTSRLITMASYSYSAFEIPINPAQLPTPQPSGAAWTGGAEPSVFSLNDNQDEQNDYVVLAYQKSSGDLSYQFSIFGRESSAHYIPGEVQSALDFNNGVATDEDRILYSGGSQLDLTYTLGSSHTLRGGLTYLHEGVTANTATTIFAVDGAGDATSGPYSITQDGTPHADFGGGYLQDEWKIFPQLTLNGGARFDAYSSGTDSENQLSPRANLVYNPWKSTTLHGGYARYFTPPPLETVAGSDITAFNGTTGASSVSGPYGIVKAERANYYDFGVSQKIPAVPGLAVGVDAYYKTAQNQLDDGFFGQSLILSSFNYERGRVQGIEFTINYETNGLSTYANVALSKAQGEGASSAQYLWSDTTEVNYINSHWVSLDHDQAVTGSFGAAYSWNEAGRWSTRIFVDALYGSGLKQDGPGLIPGTDEQIPNGSSVGAYYSVNLGVAEKLRLVKKQALVARLDIINITDNVYPLRTGTGIGVNAPQYGERRGIFGSLSYEF